MATPHKVSPVVQELTTEVSEAKGVMARQGLGAWPRGMGGMARGARAVVHPQQSDRGQR